MKLDFQDVVERAYQAVKEREIAVGQYARFSKDENKPNEYGCADAANILYTIGRMERDPEIRAAAVKTIQSMQDPETGLFYEATHHPLHTTAHCLAALELFDAGALYPVKAVEEYTDPVKFLNSLNWDTDPWNSSHQGAGLFSILTLTDMMTEKWKEAYFKQLDEQTDPASALGKKSAIATGAKKLVYHLCGHFHYLFCYHHARHPFPYPDKAIDSCLDLYRKNQLLDNFGKKFNFLEIDWIFVLHRSSRHTPHRFDEVRKELFDMAVNYREYLLSDDWKNLHGGTDLHAIFGVMTAVAELQLALPGKIITDVPLKNVLDRRPFI